MDGPRSHGVHGAIGAAEERGKAGDIVEVLHTFEIFFRIYRLNGDKFGGEPLLTRHHVVAIISHSLIDIYIFKIWSHDVMGLFEEFSIKIFKSIEDVDLDMDEVFDTGGLEVVHTSGSSGNYEESTAVEFLESLGSESSILIVGRAEHYNVSLLLDGSVDTLLNSIESDIVDDFITGATEEVGRELSTSETHSEVADSEHEHLGTVSGTFSSETEVFELACSAVEAESLDSLISVDTFRASALASARHRSLIAGSFVEVGELVGAQQAFLAASHVEVTLSSGLIDLALDFTGGEESGETAIILDLVEEFPSLSGDRSGKIFDIIRTAGGVNDLIEVRLLAEEHLLISSDTFAELIRALVAAVEGKSFDRIDTCESGAHSFGHRAEEVDMRIEESLVELAGNSVNMHLASAHALGVVSLNDLRPEHTSGAELGELHEIIGRDAHIELDAAAHFNGGDTGFGHHGHPLSAPSEGITEFLSDISSGIVEHKAIYGEAAEIIDILYDFEEFLTDFSGILGELDAMAEESLEGVIIDRTAERLSSAGILDELNELSSNFDSATGAARDIYFHLAEVDILKDNG